MTGFAAPPGQDDSMSRMAEAENYNEWLLERGRPYLGRRVLDFGAGIGTLTDSLAEDHTVVAIEPDPAFAVRLRDRFADRPNVEIVEGDDESLDALDSNFDSIVSFNVL